MSEPVKKNAFEFPSMQYLLHELDLVDSAFNAVQISLYCSDLLVLRFVESPSSYESSYAFKFTGIEILL